MRDSLVFKFDRFFVKVECLDSKIQAASFLSNGRVKHPQTAFGKRVETALKSFFEKKRMLPSFDLIEEGTPFQKKVWKAIRGIPLGEKESYGALAKKIGNPKVFRALANACGKNQIVLFTPCHRVIAANGIGGFSADIKIKNFLLQHEGELHD